MTSMAHADRNWSRTRRPPTEQLPLSFGVLYPRNAVVAVIDDDQQAALCGRALEQSGLASEQIAVMSGRVFGAMVAAAKRRRGIFGRLGAALSRLFSDDAAFEQNVIDAAREDRALVVVQAVDAASAARIGAIAHAYGGQDVRYYGRGSIEDLV